jgi:hypothetical protein
MTENQVEIEKCRIKKQMLDQNPAPHLLAGRSDTDATRAQFLQPGED